MAAVRLPEHSHCKFCGDPIPFGEEYCNDACRQGEVDRIAKEKRKDYIFYGGSIAIIIGLLILRIATK